MLKFIINPDGDLKREVPIKDGLVIGRSKGDIIIPDPQISSTHAIIKTNKTGHFFVKDMSSTNGIVTGGERVKEAFLVPGAQIKLGNTVLLVKEIEVQSSKTTDSKLSTKTLLKDLTFVDDNSEQITIDAFDKPLKITFVRGLLNKVTWELFWSPIVISTKPGSYSILDDDIEKDLDLFELSKSSNQNAIFLKNLSQEVIKVNGVTIENKGLIETGDTIEIANTTFKLDLKAEV